MSVTSSADDVFGALVSVIVPIRPTLTTPKRAHAQYKYIRFKMETAALLDSVVNGAEVL